MDKSLLDMAAPLQYFQNFSFTSSYFCFINLKKIYRYSTQQNEALTCVFEINTNNNEP